MLTIQQRLVRTAAAGLLCLLILIAGEPCRAGWQVEPGVPTTQQLRDIDGYSGSRIFAVGNAGTILQFDGTAWRDISGITDQTVYGIWWASKNEAFAVADKGQILHFDGSGWGAMASGTTLRLRDIWGASSDCMFAVGETGTILRFDGNSWKKMTSPTSLTLQSVWGSSCTSVYAVGGESGSGGTGSGTIIYYDGSQWTTQSGSATPRLQDIFGVDGSVYATGDTGTILVSNGNDGKWSSMQSGAVDNLRGIWGMSGKNLYAVGDYGTALHYDGTTWTQESAGTTQDLFAVWGSMAGSIYAVGRSGVVLRYEDNGTDNTTCPFKAAVADEDDLRLLRAVRDRQLGSLSGICLTALFYAAAPETARIVQNNPALRNQIAELVAQNRPVLQALAEGASGRMSRNALMDISAFLKELQAGGSRKLALVLAGAGHGLEHGWLLHLLDITVE
jgi:hypothetical protein